MQAIGLFYHRQLIILGVTFLDKGACIIEGFSMLVMFLYIPWIELASLILEYISEWVMNQESYILPTVELYEYQLHYV